MPSPKVTPPGYHAMAGPVPTFKQLTNAPHVTKLRRFNCPEHWAPLMSNGTWQVSPLAVIVVAPVIE